MIFFHIILHSAVLISDFHIFITSSSSFSRVYNEPIQRPAPSWLVSVNWYSAATEKHDYLFRRSVSPGNFSLKRPENSCSIYFPTGLSGDFLQMVNNAYLYQRVVKRPAEVNFGEIRYKSCP